MFFLKFRIGLLRKIQKYFGVKFKIEEAEEDDYNEEIEEEDEDEVDNFDKDYDEDDVDKALRNSNNEETSK